MVNTYKKGYNKEKRARDELKADGWFIAFKSVRWRFGTIDYGLLFDIVALKDKTKKFISCKHSTNEGKTYPQHQEEIKKFKEKYGLEGESYELWIWSNPRWRGRGKNKKFVEGYWDKKVIQ